MGYNDRIIKVQYSRVPRPSNELVGQYRWCNTTTGSLYRERADAVSNADPAALRVKETGHGVYTNRDGWECVEVPDQRPPLTGAPYLQQWPTPGPYERHVAKLEAEGVIRSTAFKADDGKPQWVLLMAAEGCAKALAGVVRVLSFAVRSKEQGGKGYVPHSWRRVPDAKVRYESALYRHLSAINHGETHDPESGESHWAHVATNALFLSELNNV